jgi:hypothetical protein
LLTLKEVKAMSGVQRRGKLVSYRTNIELAVANKTSPNEYLDGCILIMLEILSDIIKENGWTDTTPMEMFENVYIDFSELSVMPMILKRFFDTKVLVLRYNSSDAATKLRLKSSIVARGLL